MAIQVQSGPRGGPAGRFVRRPRDNLKRNGLSFKTRAFPRPREVPMLRILAVLLFVLAVVIPARAEENSIRMLVIDKDPKGTNVRDEPGGKVARVIPNNGKTDEEIETRAVEVLLGQKDWFQVRLSDGSEGWMHRSVLGSCASGTEDGPPHIYSTPDSFSKYVTVKEGTPLNFEYGPVMAANTVWAKMSYTDPSGRKVTGWIPRECLFSNPHNDCRAAR